MMFEQDGRRCSDKCGALIDIDYGVPR